MQEFDVLHLCLPASFSSRLMTLGCAHAVARQLSQAWRRHYLEAQHWNRSLDCFSSMGGDHWICSLGLMRDQARRGSTPSSTLKEAESDVDDRADDIVADAMTTLLPQGVFDKMKKGYVIIGVFVDGGSPDSWTVIYHPFTGVQHLRLAISGTSLKALCNMAALSCATRTGANNHYNIIWSPVEHEREPDRTLKLMVSFIES